MTNDELSAMLQRARDARQSVIWTSDSYVGELARKIVPALAADVEKLVARVQELEAGITKVCTHKHRIKRPNDNVDWRCFDCGVPLTP